MRLPLGIDIKEFMFEQGFIYVNENKYDDLKVTVFEASGSKNSSVGLLYFNLVFQILEYLYKGTYIQTSMYVTY